MTEEERRRARERRQEECKDQYFTKIEKRRQEAAPARIGRKKKKKGIEASTKLPQSNSSKVNIIVNPVTKCRLKLLRTERVKDYLIMEEEFIKNQERLKP